MREPRELPPHLRHRPFSVAEARAAGLSRRRTRAQDLVSPCYGVRATAALPISLLERVQALTAVTGAVVSHLSAAVLWGFPLPLALENLAVIHIFRDENARDAGWRVVALTQWHLTPFAPGMEPAAVTRVRAALTERDWTPASVPKPGRRQRARPTPRSADANGR